MEITISKTQARVPVTLVHVRGQIDSSTYQDFFAAVQKAVKDGAQYILLDMADCDYMSSAGIRSLNEIHLLFYRANPASQPKGAHSPFIKLLNPSERIRGILSISGVDAFFEIHTDRETALASF